MIAPLPPLAAGTWKSAMAVLRMNAFSGTEPLPNDGGASDDTVIVNVSVARSPAPRFESESRAVMVTVVGPPMAVGVPQTSRASVPVQPGVSDPVASNTRPVGRPDAV